jgi:hypothetical protein
VTKIKIPQLSKDSIVRDILSYIDNRDIESLVSLAAHSISICWTHDIELPLHLRNITVFKKHYEAEYNDNILKVYDSKYPIAMHRPAIDALRRRNSQLKGQIAIDKVMLLSDIRTVLDKTDVMSEDMTLILEKLEKSEKKEET